MNNPYSWTGRGTEMVLLGYLSESFQRSMTAALEVLVLLHAQLLRAIDPACPSKSFPAMSESLKAP